MRHHSVRLEHLKRKWQLIKSIRSDVEVLSRANHSFLTGTISWTLSSFRWISTGEQSVIGRLSTCNVPFVWDFVTFQKLIL
jgi:hypothetical protein